MKSRQSAGREFMECADLGKPFLFLGRGRGCMCGTQGGAEGAAGWAVTIR